MTYTVNSYIICFTNVLICCNFRVNVQLQQIWQFNSVCGVKRYFGITLKNLTAYQKQTSKKE